MRTKLPFCPTHRDCVRVDDCPICYPDTTQTQQGHCAWLYSAQHVLCDECAQSPKSNAAYAYFSYEASLHHESIDRYQQTCHHCNESVHIGQSEAWPELFDKKGCKVCVSTTG